MLPVLLYVGSYPPCGFWFTSVNSFTFEAGMTASASPHLGSIPSVAGKNLPNQSHIWSRLRWERASKKAFFSGRVAYPDDRHVLIPHMLKCRKRYMASLIRDDLLGPDTSCKCGEGTRRPALQVDSVHQIAFSGRNKMDCLFTQKFFFSLFFLPITSQWVMVVKCLMASLPRQKKVVKAWARRLIMKDEFSGNF